MDELDFVEDPVLACRMPARELNVVLFAAGEIPDPDAAAIGAVGDLVPRRGKSDGPDGVRDVAGFELLFGQAVDDFVFDSIEDRDRAVAHAPAADRDEVV